jgi:Transglycosylase SLT domain
MPTVSTSQISSLNVPYADKIETASKKYGVPATLIAAVIKQESGFDPTARSGKNAGGLMQLMPATAREVGVTNVYDPSQSIDGGTKYLAQKIKDNNGSIPLALAAYNAGQGRVNAAGGNIPNIPETKNYVAAIMANYAGGNVDPSLLNTDGSSGSSWDIGSTIVNGFQNIIRTLVTDTTKFFIYIILFGLMVFFGYQAIKGSPVVNDTITTGKKAAKGAAKTAVALIPK